MGFLHDKCSFGFFTREKANASQPFRCGDDDLGNLRVSLR